MIESVVMQLNVLCKTATLEFAISVGKVIITRIYGGDLNAWRTRTPKKDHSLRKIARHPDLPMSPAALYRSIAIYELCERLNVQSWKHVSTAHLRMVLSLASDEQARLLREAETNRWSARRLDAEIGGLARTGQVATGQRGGRKRASVLDNTLRGFEKALRTLDEVLASPEGSVQPSPDSARAAIELLRRVSRECAALEDRLARDVLRPAC